MSSTFLDADFAEQDYATYLARISLAYAKLLFPKHYQQLLTLPATGPKGLRYQLGEYNLEYFARAYFPQYFTSPIGWFHRSAYRELDSILNNRPARRRLARAWPRSFAKSTIYNFFSPVNAAVYHKRPFILQCSDTESQAQGFLADIRGAFESNDYLLEDFGECRGSVWRNDLLIVNSDFGASYVAAIGAESSSRGVRKEQYRPQLITIDDLENDASVETTDRIEKRYKWLNRALIPIGDKTTDIIYVGTVLAYDCVFDKVLNSPTWDSLKFSAIQNWSASPLWDEWRRLYTNLTVSKEEREKQSRLFYAQHTKEMLAGAKVLWEEGQPYISLMETLVDVGDLSFQAEYQNDPMNPADRIFDPSWISYYDDDYFRRYGVRITEYVGALDPSLGKSRLGDYSGIITLGRGSDGYIYVIDACIERMPPDRIIETVLEKMKEYNYTRFGVEVNQFQDLLRMQLQKEAAFRNIYLPITELRHNKDKVIRVQSLVPFVKNGYIRFKNDQRLLIDQLCAFPKGRHDDGPDALEMAVKLLGQGQRFDAMETGIDPKRSILLDDDDDDTGRTDLMKYTWADM